MTQMPDNESKRLTVSIFHATVALVLFAASFVLGGYGFYIAGFHRLQPEVVAMPASSSMPSEDDDAPVNRQEKPNRTSRPASSPARPADIHFASPANRGSESELLLWQGPARREPDSNNDRAYTPDRVVISAIGMDTPVIDVGWREVTDRRKNTFRIWDVADDAAGWHENSAALGVGGNVVLSGHNNMHGSVFRNLNKLEAGDMVTLWSGAQRYVYKIDEKVILRERGMSMQKRRENAKWIGDFGDNRLTLVSCWPPISNSHRIIVVGHFVDDTDMATTSVY